MQVSRRVLDNIALYMAWREASLKALHLNNQLSTSVAFMTPNETEAYTHMVAMYEIGEGRGDMVTQPPPPDWRQDSVPIPAVPDGD
jgi:hypothetical protein